MDLENEIRNALASPSPTLYLWTILKALIDKGESKENLLNIFSNMRKNLSLPSQDAEDDLILEMMDFLTGWCSPNMRL